MLTFTVSAAMSTVYLVAIHTLTLTFVCSRRMEKWSQDHIVSQEQTSFMKGSPNPSSINLNESTSTINLNEGMSTINSHEGSPRASTITLNEGCPSNLNEGYVSMSTINLNEDRHASTSTTNLSEGCASTSAINLNEIQSTINLNDVFNIVAP
jgi:hypothetical protein